MLETKAHVPTPPSPSKALDKNLSLNIPLTTSPDELDIRTKRELGIQSLQTIFHCFMAVLVAYSMPVEYLTNTSEVVMDSFLHPHPEPWGVRLAYLLSTTYHGVLYFWDPMSTTTLKARHVATIMLGTSLLFYEQLGWGLLIMLTNYFFDSIDFVEHRLKKVHKNRLVIASMTKVHHMVTIMLLGVSWIFGFAAFGMVVLFIHDVTDVPMFVIRIVRRRNAPTSVQTPLAVSVIFTWVYYRVWCLLQVILQAILILDKRWKEVNQHGLTLCAYSCIGGLSILWMFNSYWTYLVISKSIRELIFGKKTEVYHE